MFKNKKDHDSSRESKVGDLTGDEIAKLYMDEEAGEFNLPLIQEGIRQAELSLTEARTTKESLDKRTYFLLPLFLGFPMALLTLIKIPPAHYYFVAIILITAATVLLFSLWACDYGTLGRYPKTWLYQHLLMGNERELGYVLSVVLYDYETHLGRSDAINNRRSKAVNWSIAIAMLGVITLLFEMWAIPITVFLMLLAIMLFKPFKTRFF